MSRRLFLIVMVGLLCPARLWAAKLLIAMDEAKQTNHLKAYGIAFAAIKDGSNNVEWLLNYRGGSFVMEYTAPMAELCKRRKVSFEKLSNTEYTRIVTKVIKPDFNMDVVKLAQVPRIAVYTPLSKNPWDDAVTLALTYAEIPFEKLYVNEVLAGDLSKYDWLHLHHEDFTGQYGKFFASFGTTEWYLRDKKTLETLAAKNGYKKVSQMQLAVVKKIRDFVGSGGNMFAMCSATDTYDIALAAEGTDICDNMYDGDPADKDAQKKLDFSKCFAFKGFSLVQSAYVYEYSNIDNTLFRQVPESLDQFTIRKQPAKFDPVPSMLCQNHTSTVKGFMGQTTAFKNEVLKPGVAVLAETKEANEARYIHGEYGSGSWTFYSGHDPEDYQHNVSDPVTDLANFPHSAGYRLILNNVLFPAAKKQILPTVVYGDVESNSKYASANSAGKPAMTSRVKIFPNPSDGGLVVTISPDKIEEIVVVDGSGKEVFKKKYSSEKVTIDMNDLPAGVYLVQVNGEFAGKVVKN
ncbi:MAG: T9SS type A sorting domain-containing protein [Bacteroidota bacterium]